MRRYSSSLAKVEINGLLWSKPVGNITYELKNSWACCHKLDVETSMKVVIDIDLDADGTNISLGVPATGQLCANMSLCS